MLVAVKSLMSYHSLERKPEPSEEFETWVKVNILYDPEKQLDFMEEFISQWIEKGVDIAGEATLLTLGFDTDFNSTDERLLRWLSNRSRREAELIKGVTDEHVLMSLWDVVIEGEYSIPKATAALQEEYAFSKPRAERIARTEIITAGRAGQYHGDIQSGIVIGKSWRSAYQERTRPGHREADGQTVKLEEAFSVANASGQMELLLFPGDNSLGASASNLINCRCWYKRILEGEEELLKKG